MTNSTVSRRQLIKFGAGFIGTGALTAILGLERGSSRSAVAETTDVSELRWSYGGVGNPTRWGELSPEFATCAVGKNQSPINIEDALARNLAGIEFNYQSTPLEVVNTGRTIQVNSPPGSSFNIYGQRYDLVQFHFHTPSEHQIKGNAYAMELHLVHENQAGELAVVGVLIEEGKTHPLLTRIWENLPEAGRSNTDNANINAMDLLPNERSYYNYVGSLTTPPCSEGVNWIVLRTPIQADRAQIAQFMEFYQVNARPIQPLNGREIMLRT